MPGFKPRAASELWSKRLTVTNESFLVMVKAQAHDAQQKMPQMRKKLDKHSMEESSQISALLCAMKVEVQLLHAIAFDKYEKGGG